VRAEPLPVAGSLKSSVANSGLSQLQQLIFKYEGTLKLPSPAGTSDRPNSRTLTLGRLGRMSSHAQHKICWLHIRPRD
jgi:hypothetical protein